MWQRPLSAHGIPCLVRIQERDCDIVTEFVPTSVRCALFRISGIPNSSNSQEIGDALHVLCFLGWTGQWIAHQNGKKR